MVVIVTVCMQEWPILRIPTFPKQGAGANNAYRRYRDLNKKLLKRLPVLTVIGKYWWYVDNCNRSFIYLSPCGLPNSQRGTEI
jgi:hypothetical protein